MDIAIVTGASSSLGLAISRRLIQLGFRVYGLGGDYAECPLKNVNFKPMACDLADPKAVEDACNAIVEKEKGVYVLINNAKFFGRNTFSEMSNDEMERVLRINLLCPLVMIRTLAKSLMSLQGFLIQLGSSCTETSRGGPVGAAASGGLKWMGEVLFQDLRDHGVKVCHLSPEPNRGRDPRLSPRPGARMEASIDPEAVAQAIEQILQSPFGNIVTEMVLRPLRVREPEHEPVVRLPYPQPKPVPYTVPREMIEAEEQLEDEKYAETQRRKRERRKKPAKEKQAAMEKPREAASGDAGKKKEEAPPKEETPVTEEASGRSRRRSRRKPKPPMTQVGFADRVKESGSKPESPREAAPAKQPEPEAGPKKKTAAKKAARKTTSQKKAPAKKTATKAVKKAARKAVKKAVARKAAKKATKKAARKSPKKNAPENGGKTG